MENEADGHDGSISQQKGTSYITDQECLPDITDMTKSVCVRRVVSVVCVECPKKLRCIGLGTVGTLLVAGRHSVSSLRAGDTSTSARSLSLDSTCYLILHTYRSIHHFSS